MLTRFLKLNMSNRICLLFVIVHFAFYLFEGLKEAAQSLVTKTKQYDTATTLGT